MISVEDRVMIKEEREYAEHQSALNREHELRIRELELALEKSKHSVSQMYSLPKELIRLPVRVLLIIPLTIGVAVKKVPARLWELFK